MTQENVIYLVGFAAMFIFCAVMYRDQRRMANMLRELHANKPEIVDAAEARFETLPQTVQMPIEGFLAMIRYLAQSFPAGSDIAELADAGLDLVEDIVTPDEPKTE